MSNDDGRIGHVLVARPKGISFKNMTRLLIIGIKTIIKVNIYRLSRYLNYLI